MRVIITCERSGTIRRAFAAEGHEAWSCDLEPSEDGGPHLLGNAFDYLGPCQANNYKGWDLMIAHPPCTDLSVSGAHLFKAKRADGRQQAAIEFFMALVNADIPRICVENPVCIMSSVYRKPDQIIQPHQFGHDASKKTCLWLKGLPLLVPTKHVAPRIVDGRPRWANQTDSGQNRLSPSPKRAMDRARTYEGIASAMAQQWGNL